MNNITRETLKKVNNYVWEIPKSFRADMRAPARIYASSQMLEEIFRDRSMWQIINVATLPGIQKAAIAMPDIHEGYGFPIGGVAATATHEGGVISPGGIGYDINCGVRLLVSDFGLNEIKPHLENLAAAMFHAVPSGVGRGGKLKFSEQELNHVLARGAARMVELGYGAQDDLIHCEEGGSMAGADPEHVSSRAKSRGRDQLGTLGSGNHFLEMQVVDEVLLPDVAAAFSLSKGAIAVMIHCGSRGLGHQTCTDYVRLMLPQLARWGIVLPDRELACAPFDSPEGQKYFSAMAASANFAWANRHLIAHNVREAWNSVLGRIDRLRTIYDVAHNIGKRETHQIDGKEVEVIVHRKGATRAFGSGRPEIPEVYRAVGQPVFIPGTMGTASYVLVGTQTGMEAAFGTSCHGAGRRMSRAQAKRTVRGSELRQALEARGIVVRCESDPGLAEEAPEAYKDVESVVDIVDKVGLAKKVARLKPIAVIKGG
ncbi:MAG: hypothetical protein UX17_C0007G0019 [Parcubacteria group bacterium GW2011_GWC2_45_7]|nr:MAG: hypothetical protein UX17_C0007G0019 [Parcubacteria group bacterium GW2011_GWC2_45_7]KKU73837.1 MAG: hypothetical protein UX98_C0004G0036 [Parcubacteria group bacterium GW2011_GWA2_47_26]